MWPNNVGIRAIEVYFPSQYVEQTDLEKFDGVSAGKYTIGLGQSRMAFCDDREDINSLCLTVVHRLLDRYNIEPKEIGHLGVGTETIIDKSKSVKSVLMQIFEKSGSTDIEGIDSTNACYGGTASLFNAISWVESSAWDGRLALVVAADNAVYAPGNARPTGGAGAIAMIVGPDAPLVFDRGLRASCMRHVYDFYKPDLRSEYPVVDSKLSIECYLSSLDECYRRYMQKAKSKEPKSPRNLSKFDALLFHSPYGKLVQKSFARLAYLDFIDSEKSNGKYGEEIEKFRNTKPEETYFDRDLEKAFMTLSGPDFRSKAQPSLMISNQVGNMYTPSVYSGLVSLLVSKPLAELAGSRVGIFSYGSGLASSMYSITISSDATKESPLAQLVYKLSYVRHLLESRKAVTPQKYTDILALRELNCHTVPYSPQGPTQHLFPGTYYLVAIDDKYRRTYERKPNK
ncbi:hydroxymethylglutaryl-CoA synthase 1 [Venturia canescens]|uniref:hydroxymethylglutaryl-CoA synthase 1 n=1 Tax=Venturia canescens TaxID=32260 RepID=UPI001C9BC15C|nr:hydroxymethylglutaryl-CoA synthase 1 [Venturia canescens]